MHVLVTAIMLQTKVYVVRYFQYASCLSCVTIFTLYIRFIIWYFGNFVNVQLLPKRVANSHIVCPIVQGSAHLHMGACLHLYFARTLTSVQV